MLDFDMRLQTGLETKVDATRRTVETMTASPHRIIAIDGPAGSGKTTLAEKLAAHFDLAFLDTGLLYRATASKLLAEN